MRDVIVARGSSVSPPAPPPPPPHNSTSLGNQINDSVPYLSFSVCLSNGGISLYKESDDDLFIPLEKMGRPVYCTRTGR